MKKLAIKLVCWVNAKDGATAVEYALLSAGICLAAMAAMFLMGDSLETLFGAAETAMGQAQGRIDTTAT
jgi:Flp pilus assembly pilin Flp